MEKRSQKKRSCFNHFYQHFLLNRLAGQNLSGQVLLVPMQRFLFYSYSVKFSLSSLKNLNPYFDIYFYICLSYIHNYMSIGSRKIFKKKHRGKKNVEKNLWKKDQEKKDAKKDAKKRCVLTTFVKKILFHRLAEQNLSEHIIIGHHLPTDFRAVFCSIQCAKGSPPFFEVHKL